jgi:hypothetical protein
MSETDDALRLCARYLRQIDFGYISFEEFAGAMTRRIMCATCNGMNDEGMDRCVALVPGELLPEYQNFLDQFLLPVDYMPDAGCFVVEFTEENLVRMKRELRRRYQRLHQIIRDRLVSDAR